MRRTLYLSMACLLSALSVVGQNRFAGSESDRETETANYRNYPVRRHEPRCFDPMEAMDYYERYLYRKRGLVRAPE